MALDDRKKRILSEIVYLYEEMGEPVGSGLLAKHINLHLSAATLRAEMAALTQLGFLSQPHTSAGRVPSTAGYRYYLDNLMDSNRGLKDSVKGYLDERISGLDRQTDRFMQGVAEILSQVLHLPTYTTTPIGENMTVAHYRLLQIGLNTVLLIAIGAEGSTYTRVIRLRDKVNQKELDLTAGLINSELCFVSKSDLDRSKVHRLLYSDHPGTDDTMQDLIFGAISVLEHITESRVCVEGFKHLAYVSDNGVRLESLLRLIGDKQSFCELAQTARDIGGVLLCEDSRSDTNGLVMICESYHSGGGLTGMIGLMGPERISYATAVPTVRYIARKVSSILTA